MSVQVRSRSGSHRVADSFRSEAAVKAPKPRIWTTSAVVTIAATFTVIWVLGFCVMAGVIYERIYPPPPEQYRLYDI